MMQFAILLLLLVLYLFDSRPSPCPGHKTMNGHGEIVPCHLCWSPCPFLIFDYFSCFRLFYFIFFFHFAIDRPIVGTEMNKKLFLNFMKFFHSIEEKKKNRIK